MSYSIKCKKCGDVLVSKHRHDFKQCSCGACYVDGGADPYVRIGGDLEDIEILGEERSKYKKLEEQDYIENEGDVLASYSYHIMFPEGRDSICNNGIEEVYGKQWEVFYVHYETKDAYYGSPMEGLGLVNVMILKKDTRRFLPEEIEKLERGKLGLESAMTGELRHVWNIKINPVVSKWGDKNDSKFN